MNCKRAISFGVLLYAATFILFWLLSLFPFFDPYSMSLGTYAVVWIINIPLVLVLAKWFYKKEQPTVKNGFFLGITAIFVGLAFDALFIGMAMLAGEPTDMFKAMYSSWMFYVTILEVILLTTFAGGEFDGTYSPEAK